MGTVIPFVPHRLYIVYHLHNNYYSNRNLIIIRLIKHNNIVTHYTKFLLTTSLLWLILRFKDLVVLHAEGQEGVGKWGVDCLGRGTTSPLTPRRVQGMFSWRNQYKMDAMRFRCILCCYNLHQKNALNHRIFCPNKTSDN